MELLYSQSDLEFQRDHEIEKMKMDNIIIMGLLFGLQQLLFQLLDLEIFILQLVWVGLQWYFPFYSYQRVYVYYLGLRFLHFLLQVY